MPPPTISIIIPAYNAQQYLPTTLDSVLAQDFTNWECHIINDCSPDNTQSVIDDYVAQDARFKTQTTPHNMGAFGARNLGINSCGGQYICFLDADDVWHPHKLSAQYKFMQTNPCHISCHAYDYINETGNTIKNTVTPLPNFTLQSYMGNTCINMDTVMIDTHKTGKLQFKNAPKREDTQFWIDALGTGKTILGMPDVLASYRIHGGQISGNKAEMAIRTLHLYLNQPYINKWQGLTRWLNYTINATLKRL